MHFSGRGGSHDRASTYCLSVPTCNQYRLENESEPVISDRPTGNGYRTNALEMILEM